MTIALGFGGVQEQGDFELNAGQTGGGFDMRDVWRVHIVGFEMRTERNGKSPRVRRLSSSQLNALRQSLDGNHLYDLRGSYGCSQCSDNPVCTIEVVSKERKKQVRVYGTLKGDGFQAGSPEGIEVQRFMSVLATIKRIAGLQGIKDICR